MIQFKSVRDSFLLAVLSAATVVLLFALPAAAQQNEAIVRTAIEPEDDIRVGQRVTLRLDVLGVDGWASLPQLPRIDLPGALVYSPQSQGIRLNETIDGESYSGQRYEMWIYPQRTGEVRIPSFAVNTRIQQFGLKSEPVTKELPTKEIVFDVAMPPGASGTMNVICSTELKVQQRWRPERATAQVGDGVERVITRTIAGAPGMVLTPLKHANIQGIRVYPKQPRIDDSINRGELTGRRTDSVTYVFEQPGEYELPELALVWWDVDSKELREEILPGLIVDARPDADTAQVDDVATVPTEPERRSALPWIILFVLVVVLGGLCWRYRNVLQAMWQQIQHYYRASEPSIFRRFVRAARAGDPKATQRMLMQWLDRIEARNQPARLDSFLERFGDTATIQAAEEMIVAAQSPNDTAWNGHQLLAGVRAGRRRYKLRQRAPAQAQKLLPDLNPHLIN